MTGREQKLRRTQGCLTDAVAYYLNQHPEHVPFFVYPRQGWCARFKAFFRRLGYVVWWIKADAIPKRGTHIVCGNSLVWKTAAHVVVYRDGRVVYDPDYPSRWNDKRMTHRLMIVKKQRRRAR